MAHMTDAQAYVAAQQHLLSAVLLRQPLPGSSRPVNLPDLSFVLKQDAIYLSSENLAGPLNIPALDKQVRIVSPGSLQNLAASQPKLAFLQFGPPEESENGVKLSLWIRLASGRAGQPVLGLSGVLAEFAKDGEDWTQIGEPVYAAG